MAIILQCSECGHRLGVEKNKYGEWVCHFCQKVVGEPNYIDTAIDWSKPDQTTTSKEPSGPVNSHIPSGDTHSAADLSRHLPRSVAGFNTEMDLLSRAGSNAAEHLVDPVPFVTTDTRLGWLTVAESITAKRRDARDG